MDYFLSAIVGYLLGSIPFGLLITRAAGLGDVRKIGSGNIGATNVLRTGRRELAAATLVLDAAKGAVAVLIARWLWPGDPVFIAAIAAFIGHCFPAWLGFKGGKGVATYIGVMLALCWPVGLIFCAVWLLIAVIRRISSLSALTAAVTSPLFAYSVALMGFQIDGTKLAATAGLLSVILIFNHRANIARLISGTEPRIGSEKKASG
jgi:glycerol-3-phosphate acyltransferase PlsY